MCLSDSVNEDAHPPCPFCGCRCHIEDAGDGDPGTYAVLRCTRCGYRFEGKEPTCSRCGSRGELLGEIDIPDHYLCAQYRCRGCGHGFIARKAGGDDARLA
ncbi:MAG: hypothetical protein WC093_06465 [Methanoculleus sp.]